MASPKTFDQRLTDALAALAGLPTDAAAGQRFRSDIEIWLAELRMAERDKISGDLSLGGYLLHTENEKRLRNARRALMLVRKFQSTRGPAAPNLRPAADMSLVDIRAELDRYIAERGAAPGPLNYISSASFEQFATAAEKAVWNTACGEVRGLLTSSYMRAAMAKQSYLELARYEKFFGPFDIHRHRQVVHNFSRMTAWAGQIKLWYRGDRLRGANFMEVIAPGQAPVAVYPDPAGNYGGYSRNALRDADGNGHVMLGPAAFSHCADRPANANQYPRVGVLIHELSHAIAGTEDRQVGTDTLYGDWVTRVSGIANSPRFLWNNADSYRLFAQESVFPTVMAPPPRR